MRTLICILLLTTGCVQYIERYPDGTEKYKYNSLGKTMTADGIIIGDMLIEGARGEPQDVDVITPYGTVGVEK